MKPIVVAENLSKQYQIGEKQAHYASLRESITGAVRSPLKRLRKRAHSTERTVWALRNVSFEVEPGEAVGIIGRNGAGKSTLLKILSRITLPTSGSADLYGRFGSLLEVGTGFHPELTGRENIHLNGAILGMKRREIDRKFDEIVAFAETEKFLDTQVKYYSSGMHMRLAFAVAAHLEPEILVVDEVLAVGDANFQKKCLGRMGEVAKEGRTVLFVSHNMTAVQSMCERAIWLHDGELLEDGPPGQVVSNYLSTSFSTTTEQKWAEAETAPGNGLVRLRSTRVRPENGTHSDPITVRTPFVIEFEYDNLHSNSVLHPSIMLFDEEGTLVFHSGPSREPVWNGHPFPIGRFHSECHVPGDLLNDGAHRVRLSVIKDFRELLFRYDDVLSFDVREAAEERKHGYAKVPGAVRPRLDWQTKIVEEHGELRSQLDNDSAE